MKCLFCDFFSGKRNNHSPLFSKFQEEVYSFFAIYKSKLIISFISHPNKLGESEILIVPIKHYEFIEEVPEKIQKELILFCSKIAEILHKEYGGSNILLNNGFVADQYIPHVHFHIIPKNKDKENPWRNLTSKKHKNLSLQFKEKLKNLKICK